MAQNKNAQIRYKTLERCFSNIYKKYFINDLIKHCSGVLTDYYVAETTISRRQILADINFMRSEAGFDAPIESYKDGKKVFYRYSNPKFSILKSPLNPSELNSLNEAIETLSRINNQSLDIKYKSFISDQEKVLVVSPYYLKQYNNRWFLFGYNNHLNKIQNLALDRIINIKPSKAEYKICEINFDEYFSDIIGVSNEESKEPVDITIELSENIIPYINSKPLHGSQRIIGNVLYLKVKLNYELESLILSYGENMYILQPKELKLVIKDRIDKIKLADSAVGNIFKTNI